MVSNCSRNPHSFVTLYETVADKKYVWHACDVRFLVILHELYRTTMDPLFTSVRTTYYSCPEQTTHAMMHIDFLFPLVLNAQSIAVRGVLTSE